MSSNSFIHLKNSLNSSNIQRSNSFNKNQNNSQNISYQIKNNSQSELSIFNDSDILSISKTESSISINSSNIPKNKRNIEESIGLLISFSNLSNNTKTTINNNSINKKNNNRNNNNNNLSPFGFVSEIIKFADNYANNNHSNNQNRINSNNNIHRRDNPIQNGLTQIGNAFSNISRTVTSLNELTRQFNNLSTQMNSNSNSNSVRYRNPISNSNRNDNQAPPPVNNINIPPNPNNNNNIFPPNILIPPIIIGHPGQIFNPFHQRNNINIDAIMNLLPSSIITEKKESEGQENNCIICIGDFEIGDKVTSLPCLHVFHTECIKSWLQSKNHCPICKYNITEESLRRGN